jgi:hypothetical protein
MRFVKYCVNRNVKNGVNKNVNKKKSGRNSAALSFWQ